MKIDLTSMIEQSFKDGVAIIDTTIAAFLEQVFAGKTVSGTGMMFIEEEEDWTDLRPIMFVVQSVKWYRENKYIAFTSIAGIEYEFESEIEIVE